MKMKSCKQHRRLALCGLAVSLCVLAGGAVSVVTGERSFCDMGAALNPADPTNGGFWTVTRANAVVCDSSASVSAVVVAPGNALKSSGTDMDTTAPGAVILFM